MFKWRKSNSRGQTSEMKNQSFPGSQHCSLFYFRKYTPRPHTQCRFGGLCTNQGTVLYSTQRKAFSTQVCRSCQRKVEIRWEAAVITWKLQVCFDPFSSFSNCLLNTYSFSQALIHSGELNRQNLQSNGEANIKHLNVWVQIVLSGKKKTTQSRRARTSYLCFGVGTRLLAKDKNGGFYYLSLFAVHMYL